MPKKTERRANHRRARPQKLVCDAPTNHADLTLDELFTSLLVAGGWTYDGLADLMMEALSDEGTLEDLQLEEDDIGDVTSDTIKSWALKDVAPSDVNRHAFFEVLRDQGNGFENSWIHAFTQQWIQKRIESRRDRQRRKTAHQNAQEITADIQDFCRNNPKLTYLPSLFETDQPLPVASAYVDLSVVESSVLGPNPDKLHAPMSLAQKINARFEQRFATRRSPTEMFDTPIRQTALILGDPGAGKSSLLKRIALDIASGKWEHSKIPVLIEAREFWHQHSMNPNLTLLDYAMSQFAEATDTAPNELKKRIFPSGSQRPDGLLLVDGLDEIASSPSAVDLVYGQLRQLGAHISWIVACRPTGLVSNLFETTRCEIVDLDEEAIESLVRNWCQSVSGKNHNIDPDPLLSEVFGSASNRELAHNPFLLTALCFLKSEAPTQGLPTSRVEVYSELIEKIGLQARRKRSRADILRPADIKNLEDFCMFLYEQREARQVFTMQDWSDFEGAANDIQTDFTRSIVPARLLTSWNVVSERFHFLHLSLQEFFVAKAMLSMDTDFAFSKRFFPAWRPVFRLYGALLLASGRKDEFKSLATALFEERDFTGFTYITVAEIFADAGIRDTSEWIGEDLRERLYFTAMSGEEVAPEALTDALAMLDPEWLVQKAKKTLAHRLDMVSKPDAYGEFVVVGTTVDSPYQVLARARTKEACEIVKDAFFGDNIGEAVLAAHAFAMIATPKDRAKAREKVLNGTEQDPFSRAFTALADATRRIEFLPALGRIIEWFQGTHSGEHREALRAVAHIGGPEAANILAKALEFEASDTNKDVDGLELVMRTIVSMGGDEARRVLLGAGDHPKLADWRDVLEVMCLEAVPTDTELAKKFLADPKYRDEAIDALAGAATYGRAVSEEICLLIARDVHEGASTDIMDVANLEGARLDEGLSPILCTPILEGAKQIFAQYKDPDFEAEKEMLLNNFRMAFDTLGRAPWLPARDFVKRILFDPDTPEEILSVTLDLCGRVYANTKDEEIIDRLVQIWFKDPGDHSHGAALAVGRIDLEELFYYQSAHNAYYALEQIAADEDLLIFNDFYAARDGTTYEWADPPKGLLFLFSETDPGHSGDVAHLVSWRGYCMMPEDHKRCVAAFILPGADDWCRAELEIFEANPEFAKPRPVLKVPDNIDFDNMAEIVDNMLKDLEKRL